MLVTTDGVLTARAPRTGRTLWRWAGVTGGHAVAAGPREVYVLDGGLLHRVVPGAPPKAPGARSVRVAWGAPGERCEDAGGRCRWSPRAGVVLRFSSPRAQSVAIFLAPVKGVATPTRVTIPAGTSWVRPKPAGAETSHAARPRTVRVEWSDGTVTRLSTGR